MEPNWLSAEQQTAWRPFAALLFRLPGALDAQLQQDAGISHFEYMVLAALSEAPARTLRMSELARMASGSLSRLSHVVSRMESRGWVRREPCPGDGRFINAVLTEDGWTSSQVLSVIDSNIPNGKAATVARLALSAVAEITRSGPASPSR